MAEWRQTADGRCKEYVVRTPEYIAKVALNPLSVRLSINVRDEEDDGNAIDIRISRKMINNTRELINSYIGIANLRYKTDIPRFEPPKESKMIKEEKTEYYTAVVRLESWGVSARVRLNPEKKNDPLFLYLPSISSPAETLNEVGQIPFEIDTCAIGAIPYDKAGTYGRAIMEAVRVVEYLSRIIWN